MDNIQILELISRCAVLKYIFNGVWSADNFPKLKKGHFQIVNSSQKNQKGTHWLLVARLKCGTVIFWDSLGNPIERYGEIYLRCLSLYLLDQIEQIHLPLQSPSSNMCAIYCIYMAHILYLSGKNTALSKCTLSETELIQFVNSHLNANVSLTFL